MLNLGPNHQVQFCGVRFWFRTSSDRQTGYFYFKKIIQYNRLINDNGQGGARCSELCLSRSRYMALAVSTLQYLEGSEGLRQERVAAGSCCDATAGESSLRGHSGSLNGKIVFDNLRHGWILNRMALSKM